MKVIDMTLEAGPLPLSGMVVLDLSQILAGPVCTMVLADMGANVVKVERPGRGDDNRHMGPSVGAIGSAGFMAVNRNKRSLALDLRQHSGRETFQKLVGRADVWWRISGPG